MCFDRYLDCCFFSLLSLVLATLYREGVDPHLLRNNPLAKGGGPVLVPATEEESSVIEALPPAGPPVPIPPDDVPDSDLTPEMVRRRAEELYPTISPITGGSPKTLNQVFSQDVQRNFRRTLNAIDPRITAKLDQPFGKENLRQVFTSEASLRHILLPLWKSGFLFGDPISWKNLRRAYYPARVLHELLVDLGDVDFTAARGFPTGWDSETSVNEERVRSVTAALLHLNGSGADLVRYIGGPHVNAHLDKPKTLTTLRDANVDPRVVKDVERILLEGIPQKCVATSTEANFAEYFRYGNHSTVDEEPEKTYKALVKDNKRGYTLLLDARAVLFLLHSHLTPQGVVDLNSTYKNPRPIFDSSFRPFPWCHAINDWTTKDTEPPLTFQSAELGFMIWLYNLRITYPDLEIYIADDDISGAFRRLKYHPNCVSLHASIQCGYLVLNTGGTFGDNTSPSNFDPLTVGRRQLAQHVWLHDDLVVSRTSPFLPKIETVPTEETVSFTPADADTINTGVLNEDGSRKPPPFNMHVDDNLYADILTYLVRTICASVWALFMLLGSPTDTRVPSPLSTDKFEATYNHKRRLVGRQFNSRTMTVGILPHKRAQLDALLSEWSGKKDYSLHELAQLLGILENHTRYARWCRCWFFALQNSARRALYARFHILSRKYDISKRRRLLRRHLPKTLMERLSPLIAREKAQFLWDRRARFTIGPEDAQAIAHLLAYVRGPNDVWEVPLGMIVPREPHFTSRGDASHMGGGGYSLGLGFWFEIVWSPKVISGVKLSPSDSGYVHINSLEFVVVIFQLAAVVTRMRQPGTPGRFFPGRKMPHIPVWLGETDNSASRSWENRISTKSPQGQSLLILYAELLRTGGIHTQCKHLAGEANVIADDISRNDFSLPPSVRWEQLFRKHPCLATCDFFRPSPELLQLTTSLLFSRYTRGLCDLPPVLGHFEPASSITSTSVTI